MDKKIINQKEYLKKYLMSGKDKKKIKRKKPKVGSKTVKIIDDDIDVKNMRAIEDGEFDIFDNSEDGPQIAGIIDERGPVDFSDKKRWKIITDDGDGDISITNEPRNERILNKQGRQYKNTDSNSNSVKNHLDSRVVEYNSPRRSKKNSDYRDNDCSTSHKSKKNTDSQDSDFSSSRKSRKKYDSQDSDYSPPRKSNKNAYSQESDYSPPRETKKSAGSQGSDFSPPRKSRKKGSSQDNDYSPPTRLKKNSDSDESTRKKLSLKKYRPRVSDSEDSDSSPRRKGRQDSGSDLSPPRNRKSEKGENKYSQNYEHSSRSSRRDKFDNRTGKTRFSASLSTEFTNCSSSRSKRQDDSYKSDQYSSKDNSLEYDRNHHKSRKDYEKSSSRSKDRDKNNPVPPRNRKTDNGKRILPKHFKKAGNGSDSDLSPPRESRKKHKNLNSDSSLPQKNIKNYQMMTAETSGFGQAPIVRDRKTGRKRDLAAEAREQEDRDEKRQELEEKYAQWGKGLKQVEDRQEKLNRDLYEMSKPLARYADDADLERELKAQEREGDPMLAYIKQKQIKEGKKEPEKPRYNGPFMPNRFGIRPGYRWDGVDRSNGYEKKWFDAQNARKAVQEEAYKWSTADM